MRIIVILMVGAVAVNGFADDSTNRVEIVKSYLDILACDVEDDFEDETRTQEVSWVSWTQGGFFGRMSDNENERNLYQAAFESYIRELSTNDWNAMSSAGLVAPPAEVARIALGQCRDMNYTNALSSLRVMAFNPTCPYRRDATALSVAFCRPDFLATSFVEDVLTNSTFVASDQRQAAVFGYVGKIQGPCTIEVKRNAVSMLYRNRFRDDSLSVTLDGLFVNAISGYDLSSNRLQTVARWLGGLAHDRAIAVHLISITNQLMNAAQPLVVIEGLQ